MAKKGTGFREGNAAVKGNSGRVGNVRYYTRGDRTYTRVAASDVANPRSFKQQKGRAKMGNIICHWKYLKYDISKYFEYANKAVTAYNIFTKRALQGVPIYLGKDEQYKKEIAAPYCVSEGSLPMIHYGWNGDGRIVSNIKLGDDFSIDENTTVYQFTDAVIKNNEEFLANDELAFVAVLQQVVYDSPSICVEFSKIPLDGKVAGMKVDLNTKLYEVVDKMGFECADGCLSTIAEPFAGCYAWIHVRKDPRTNEVVSSSTQELFNANEEMVKEYSSEEAFKRIYESFGKVKPVPLFYPKSNNP